MVSSSRQTTRLTINALSAITTLTLLSATAHPESGAAIPGRSAALNVQSDDSDSHDVAGTLVLPFGQHAWTQLMAGSTHARIDNESTDTRMAGASVGLQTGAFQSRLAFAYRKDNDSLRLQDWNGAVTYFAKQGSLGIDLFYRTSEDETVISRGGRLRNPKAIAITESFAGRGIGLHGDFDVSENAELFAAGMKYDYQDTADRVSTLRIERLVLSGVTRDTALLEDTMSVGGTWKLQPLWLTLSYVRDHALDTHELTQTAELTADIFVGEHWILTPRVGYSSTDAGDDVGYAGVTAQLSW